MMAPCVPGSYSAEDVFPGACALMARLPAPDNHGDLL